MREIDGATHGQEAEVASDARRTLELEWLGYRVVRVTNEDVRQTLDGVFEGLLAILERRV